MSDAIVKNNSNAMVNTNDFDIPRGYICTLDITELDGKLMLAKALNGAISMRDKVDEVLRVTDIVTTKGVRAISETECTNTYLICEDGTVYFTQSDGIARSVEVIVGLFTDPVSHQFINPVSQGVGMKVVEQDLGSGKALKTLVPVKL